jgi:hypothetical protein
MTTNQNNYSGIQTVTFADKRTGLERKTEIDYDQIFIGENGYVFHWKQFQLLSRHFAGFVNGQKPSQAQWGQARKLEGAMRSYYGTVVAPMTRGQFQEILDTDAKAPKALVDMLFIDAPKVKAKASKSPKSPKTPKLSAKQVVDLSDDPEKLYLLLESLNLIK